MSNFNTFRINQVFNEFPKHKEETKDYNKEYKEKHKEEINEHQKRYYKDNKED